MEHLKLCESDYRFMTVIWENEPLPSGRLVELCAQKLGWKKPTTYTTLKKLCEKGFAKNENTIVTALIPRERVQAYASEHFVEHTFQGSLPGFLAAFLGGKVISEQEAEDLKRLIDSHKEDEDGKPVSDCPGHEYYRLLCDPCDPRNAAAAEKSTEKVFLCPVGCGGIPARMSCFIPVCCEPV